MRTRRHLSLLLMAVAAAAIIIGVFSREGSRRAAAALGDPGTAEFTVAAPSGAQPLNTPFNVTIDLSQFFPSGIQPTWGGYDSELQYNGAVLQVLSVTRGLCSSAGWGLVATSPNVVTACAFQSSTATGTLDTVSFQCIENGVSNLIEVPRGGQGQAFSGSALFDENGGDFVMTFVNTSVTCGSAATPTPTNTVPPTDTPTPTSTVPPTNTPTPTNTLTSGQQTATAGAKTASAAQTQTAQANFGGASTATPLPETQTAVAQLTATATATTAGGEAPPPSGSPGGGGGAAASPTRPGGGAGAGIILPETGSGGARALPDLWLIVGGAVLAAAGGGLFVTSRRVR